MIETDAPWCDVRSTHASCDYLKHDDDDNHGWNPVPAVKKERFVMGSCVKGRNEPAMARQLLQLLATIFELPQDRLATQILDNTIALFNLKIWLYNKTYNHCRLLHDGIIAAQMSEWMCRIVVLSTIYDLWHGHRKFIRMKLIKESLNSPRDVIATRSQKKDI